MMLAARRRAPNTTNGNSSSSNGGSTRTDPSAKAGRRACFLAGKLKLLVVGLLLILLLFAATNNNNNNVNVEIPIVEKHHQESPPSTTTAVTNNKNDSKVVKAQESTKPPSQNNKDPWKFFNGNLNEFYNNLEKDIKRNASSIEEIAVHRWMGSNRSTYEHYYIMTQALQQYYPQTINSPTTKIRVFDGGCGLGAGLMWLEQQYPSWQLLGHTISETQYNYINTKVPPHKFTVELKSYDDLNTTVDFIYTIEALLHSPNLTHTLQVWAEHLSDGGVFVVIDDFLAIGASREDDEEVQAFVQSWQAPSLVTPTQMVLLAKQFDLVVKQARDLNAEYQINEQHYRNELEAVKVTGGRRHQAWKGSKVRGRLMVTGKLTYNMLVFQKVATSSLKESSQNECTSVSLKKDDNNNDDDSIKTNMKVSADDIGDVDSSLLSSAYHCNKGSEWFERFAANGTNATSLGGESKLEKDLFDDYKDVFASRLNDFYATLDVETTGKFANLIGSSASSETETDNKLRQVAGPLQMWTVAWPTASSTDTNRTIECSDISNCPTIEDCSFDVTFSLGLLEHTKEPWNALDEIARITKQGALTMHVVPFSFPFHEEKDHYRFSHLALTSLLEERGFTVLNAGYDICTKSTSLRSRRPDHLLYDVVWLAYIVAEKT